MAHSNTTAPLAGPPFPPSKPAFLPPPQTLPQTHRLSQQPPSQPSVAATSPHLSLTSAPPLSRQEPTPVSPSSQPTPKPPGTLVPRTSSPLNSTPPHPAHLLPKAPSAPVARHGATGSTTTM